MIASKNEQYDRIQRLCDERRMTATSLCRAIGISQGILGDLKSGRTKKLSATNLSKIADYFHVTTDYLITGRDAKEEAERAEQLINGDPELTEYLQQLSERSEMRMLFHVTKHATKEQIEAIVRMVESLQTPEE